MTDSVNDTLQALADELKSGEVEAVVFAVIRTHGDKQSYEMEGKSGVIGDLDETMATLLLGFTRLAEEDLIEFLRSDSAKEHNDGRLLC